MNDTPFDDGQKLNKALPLPAQRALEEARLRREKADAELQKRPEEVDGRDGPEPTRYGDWEKNGILSDF